MAALPTSPPDSMRVNSNIYPWANINSTSQRYLSRYEFRCNIHQYFHVLFEISQNLVLFQCRNSRLELLYRFDNKGC